MRGGEGIGTMSEKMIESGSAFAAAYPEGRAALAPMLGAAPQVRPTR